MWALIEKLLGDLTTEFGSLLLHQLLLFLERHSQELLSLPLNAWFTHHSEAACHGYRLYWHRILTLDTCQVEDGRLLWLGLPPSCARKTCKIHIQVAPYSYSLTVVSKHIVYFL